MTKTEQYQAVFDEIYLEVAAGGCRTAHLATTALNGEPRILIHPATGCIIVINQDGTWEADFATDPGG